MDRSDSRHVAASSADNDAWKRGALWVGFKDIIAGSVGGGCLTIVGYPFDTVKIRIQAQPAGSTVTTLDIARQTLRNEGLGGFFKGMASPLAGQLFACSACFFSYGQAKFWLRPSDWRDGQNLSLPRIFLAGGFCGVVLSAMEGPIDLFKIKMQMQQGKASDITRYAGSGDAARQIFRAHGLRGVTQGLGATVLRNGPANAMYFTFYEITRRAFVPEGEPTPALVSMAAGSTAGFGYWVFGLPTDVIKSNIQADAITAPKYRGIVDCARQLYRAQGAAAFTRGWVPCVLRSAPSNAALFFGFDLAQSLLSRFE